MSAGASGSSGTTAVRQSRTRCSVVRYGGHAAARAAVSWGLSGARAQYRAGLQTQEKLILQAFYEG
ncbi:MAG: hypothetical protein ACYDHT_07355 [Solirubrobacteraceae bacterium]